MQHSALYLCAVGTGRNSGVLFILRDLARECDRVALAAELPKYGNGCEKVHVAMGGKCSVGWNNACEAPPTIGFLAIVQRCLRGSSVLENSVRGVER